MTLVQLGEDFIIYYTPSEALEIIREILGDQEYKPQSGADLGERLYNGIRMANELSYKYCIALASDVPDITVNYLCEAVESLKTHDVVIGPSTDGGYNLIGINLDINSRDFFTGIKWGTNSVYDETMKRVEGLDVYVLPYWGDIDEASDLKSHKFRQDTYTYRYLLDNKLL